MAVNLDRQAYFTPIHEFERLFNKSYVQTNKIVCIKMIREITGEGLREAKDFFENVVLPYAEDRDQDISQNSKTTLREELDLLKDQVSRMDSELSNLKRKNTAQTAKGIFDYG